MMNNKEQKGPYSYPLLQGSANYESWAMKTEAMLEKDELWDASCSYAALTSKYYHLLNRYPNRQLLTACIDSYHNRDT